MFTYLSPDDESPTGTYQRRLSVTFREKPKGLRRQILKPGGSARGTGRSAKVMRLLGDADPQSWQAGCKLRTKQWQELSKEN